MVPNIAKAGNFRGVRFNSLHNLLAKRIRLSSVRYLRGDRAKQL